MRRHIRAEWYRVIHSGSFFKIMIAAAVFSLTIRLLMDLGSFDKPLFGVVSEVSEFLGMVFPCVICTVCAATLGSQFSNRTAYYEIMDGASPHKIILGKYLTYVPLGLLLLPLPMGIYFAVIGLKNGLGGMKSPLLFALLFTVVAVHILSVTVFYVLIAKKMIAGAVAPYLRFVLLEQFGYMMMIELNRHEIMKWQKIMDWFPTVQVMRLAQAEYSSEFVVAVLLSFVIETAFLYAVTVYTYKQRKFC